MPTDFRTRYAPLVDKLRAEQSRWIGDARILHMLANVPPWTAADIELERGDRLTVLAAGRVIWSREADLFAGPRYHLWARIGDGPIFRLGSDTHTLAARGTARSGCASTTAPGRHRTAPSRRPVRRTHRSKAALTCS